MCQSHQKLILFQRNTNKGSFSGVAKRVADEEGIRCFSPKTAPKQLPKASPREEGSKATGYHRRAGKSSFFDENQGFRSEGLQLGKCDFGASLEDRNSSVIACNLHAML